MAIPVKFYSVTAEEYERIRQEIEAAKERGEKSDKDSGIYFVEDSGEITKGE